MKTRVNNGWTCEAWLIVARGGWWSPAEIAEAVPSGLEVTGYHGALLAMVRHGTLATRGRSKTRAYAVTPECLVPMGIQVKRAVEAMAIGVTA